MLASDSREREAAVLARLRDRYQSQGYQFFEHPTGDLLPPFLGTYRPDAIALLGDGGVVIEVKGPDRDPTKRLADVAALFEGRRQWELKIILADDPAAAEPALANVADEELRRQSREVEKLARAGHVRAAFLLSWSVLEAAARRALRETARARPFAARDLVEALTYEGLVSQEEGRRLRELARMRNAAAHGDFSAAITAEHLNALVAIMNALISGLDT